MKIIPENSGWFYIIPLGEETAISGWYKHSENINECYFLPDGLPYVIYISGIERFLNQITEKI